MDNLNCPDCGQAMMVMRSGTRKMGSGPGPWADHGIPTTAKCDACGALWDRDYGDRGPWLRREEN